MSTFARSVPLLALTALGVAGCQASNKSESAQSLEARVSDIDQKHNQRYLEMKDYLQERETKVRNLEDEVERLKRETNVLRFQVQTLLAARGGGDPAVARGEVPDTVVSGLDAAQRIDQGLATLQSKEGQEAAVSADFQSLGQPAVDALVRELRASVRNRDATYQGKVEKVLAKLNTAYVIPSTAPLLEDAGVAVAAAHVLGLAGDAAAVPFLKKHVRDRDPDLKLAVAEALVALHSEEGIPVLIEALKGDQTEVRILAFDSLKRATGQTMNYRIYASPTENAKAIEDWQTWWREYGPTYRLPEGGKQ